MPLHPAPTDTGPLTVEQATSLLDAPPAEDEKKEKPQASEAEPSAAESGEAEKPIPEDEGEGEKPEAGAEEEQEVPAIDPPHSWDAEAKAKFSELPREMQEYLSGREKSRDTAISKALQEAADKRKGAEEAGQRFAQFSAVLENLLPQVQQTFQDRWSKVDWNQLIEQVGAEEALKLRVQHENEQKQVMEVQNITSVIREMQYADFLKEEAGKLPTISPELADPKEGSKRKVELQGYLVENGYSPDRLRYATAMDVTLAWKAMQYDKAKKGLSQPKPKLAATAQAKPSAAPSRSSSTNQKLQELDAKFKRDGRWSVNDAVAALNAKGT